MDILQQIQHTLEPLNFYDLSQDSLVKKELETYALVLEEAKGKLDTILQESLIQTAEDLGLDMREKLYGSTKTAWAKEQRRGRLIALFSLMNGEWNGSFVQSFLNEEHFSGTISEHIDNESLLFQDVTLQTNQTGYKKLITAIEAVLPAHLKYNLDIPEPNWTDMDANNLTFDVWDSLNYRWELYEYDA